MSNPNKSKSTLAFGKANDVEGGRLTSKPTASEPAPPSEPIKLAKDEFVSIAGLASSGRDNLIDALRGHMEKAKIIDYVPPPVTERRRTQREAEMEAGRRAVAKTAAERATRPQPKRDPSEGYTTPVYRPGDHVPSLDSGDLGARTVK